MREYSLNLQIENQLSPLPYRPYGQRESGAPGMDGGSRNPDSIRRTGKLLRTSRRSLPAPASEAQTFLVAPVASLPLYDARTLLRLPVSSSQRAFTRARANARQRTPYYLQSFYNPCRIPVVIHPARVQRAHARIRQKNFILDQSTLRPGCRTDPRRILTAFSSLTACACYSSPLPMRSSPRPSPARN